MPTRSEVYRVMIGSPSDLSEERLAATAAVNEWNAQHTDAEGVVLLPVMWETHAMPTSGVRPQSAINDQLVDRCDILIGMFWTKLGTATGVAASGTVEEIDRFVAAGKPAMLYFSQRKAAKGKVDPKQAAKLQKFKTATYKKSLVGSFASVAELKRILVRDLTRQIRLLQPGTPFIQFAFLPSREQTQARRTSIPVEKSKNAYTVSAQPIWCQFIAAKSNYYDSLHPLAGRADCLGDANGRRERDRRRCLNPNSSRSSRPGVPWLISDFQNFA
jgi:Domain of unknown function (DUF4062)